MESAKDFENVRIELNTQIRSEIENLKNFLIENDGLEDLLPEKVIKRIIKTAEGLKMLTCVQTFMDCWEENGEPPQINQIKE